MPSPAPKVLRPVFGPVLMALCLGLGFPMLAQETDPVETVAGDAGAFLAARAAAAESDHAAAAEWFARALVSDTKNPGLLEGAILANIGLGDWGPAANMARALQDTDASSQAAYLALLVEAISAEDYERVLAQSRDGASDGALLDVLVSAWAQVGLGRMSEATETLDSLSKTQGMATFGMYHKALALASAAGSLRFRASIRAAVASISRTGRRWVSSAGLKGPVWIARITSLCRRASSVSPTP